MRERKGTIVSFHAEKRYGFAKDSSGETHFVHANELVNAKSLVVGQEVEFDTKPTPKGSRAVNVSAHAAPVVRKKEQAYINPDRFIMTRESEVRGFEIVCLLDSHFWATSNDPNEAREMMKQHAMSLGANAVVALDVQRYTEQEACSNYQYSMHRVTGAAVVVKRKIFTDDQDVINASRESMGAIEEWKANQNAPQKAGNDGWTNNADSDGWTKMVKPPAFTFFFKLTYSWIKTFGKIFWLMTLHALRSGFQGKPR